MTDSLRVALLAYRGNPRSGGQGVYVRHLSRALAGLGHRVTVFAGPPYPVLDDGVGLVRLPSLELYLPEDPFRRPALREFRDAIDVAEYAIMCAAGFPEPLTFSLRAWRTLSDHRLGVNWARRRYPIDPKNGFDVVHDNQGLGYGLLGIARRIPTLATIHHPITIDREVELAHAGSVKRRMALRRWYAFVRMQGRVARRLPRIVTVSERAREDIVNEFGVRPERVDVVPNGVDTSLFRPVPGVARVPGRIVTTASADVPLKGLVPLLEAVAKLRTERPVELVVIGSARRGGPVARALERLGLEGAVRFTDELPQESIAEVYARAEVAVVPSLYEGFSLPALEAMACGVPLVGTRVGAMPELARDGCAVVVEPGDAGALAEHVGRLLDDADLRERMSRKARDRVLDEYTWSACARRTTAVYESLLRRC